MIFVPICQYVLAIVDVLCVIYSIFVLNFLNMILVVVFGRNSRTSHYVYYVMQVVDLALNVNVEFMLCPTSAMLTIFPLVPSWVLWPSYRSTLTHVVIIVGSLISYTYVGAASLIRMALPSRSLASSAASAVKKRS